MKGMLNEKTLMLVFLLLFLTLLVGCFPTPVPSNEAPIITSTPVTTAIVGLAYTYDVNATDPNGDVLTYSLVAKPTNMTINSATGLIKWTPVAAQLGNNSVTVKVSDGSLSINQGFIIKVSTLPPVNQKPVITSSPNLTATVGVTYIYDVNATDPNGDTLTYSLTTKPSGMNINSANGLIIWAPTTEGNYAVVVKVSDGTLDVSQSFTITVSAVEPEPEPEIELTGIVVNPKTMSLVVGKSDTIKSVTATYEIRGSTVPIALGECTYESDYPSIAKVEKVGDTVTVTAVAEGSAKITVSYGGETDTLEVTVSEFVLELIGIKVSPDTMILLTGGTKSFTVTAHYNDDTAKFVTSACAHGIDDDSIATVEAGKVTALEKVGTATIFINYTEGDITKEANLTVTVGDTITISWGEAAVRYFPDGTVKDSWLDSHDYGADLIKVDGGYSFADIDEYFNWLMTEEMGLEGSVVINETGALSGWATYTTKGLDTRNDFVGQVEIIIYDVPVGDIDGTMVGDYTQWKYVYAESDAELGILANNYLKAVLAPEQGTGWWFTSYTEYTAYEE